MVLPHARPAVAKDRAGWCEARHVGECNTSAARALSPAAGEVATSPSAAIVTYRARAMAEGGAVQIWRRRGHLEKAFAAWTAGA